MDVGSYKFLVVGCLGALRGLAEVGRGVANLLLIQFAGLAETRNELMKVYCPYLLLFLLRTSIHFIITYLSQSNIKLALQTEDAQLWFTSFINCFNFVQMAEENSLQSQPWTQLDKGSCSIFQDDFLSDKLVFKAKKKSSASTVAVKQQFRIAEDAKAIKSDEELRFWLPFSETHTLYFKLKGDNYKLHYDYGVRESKGLRFNWYGSAQGKRSLNPDYGDNFKVGLEIRGEHWSTNHRLSITPFQISADLYNKTTYTYNKFSLGTVNVFQALTNAWIHSAFQLGWQDNSGNDYYLRANANAEYQKINPKDYLANVTANYIYKLNANNNLGVQVGGNLATQQVAHSSFVWDHSCQSRPNTGVKIKADLLRSRNVAASIKNAIPGYGSYIFGVNIHDLGGANRFSYGVQVDLNI